LPVVSDMATIVTSIAFLLVADRVSRRRAIILAVGGIVVRYHGRILRDSPAGQL
jgi:hypothetical protein